MAHVEDRRYRDVEGEKTPTDRHGTGRRWRGRWIDPDGRERSQSFTRRVDAERHLAAVEGDKLRGLYVDPRAGQVTLRQYATEWLAAQTFDESSREGVEYRLRLHVFPQLGDREIGAIRSSHVQTLLRALQDELAPSYVRAIFLYLSAVMSAAVDDGRITKNPCKASSIKVRGPEPRKVQPWTHDQVHRLHHALPARYKVVVALAAGCGLRQGEVFGLAVEDIDFLRRVVHVRRQVKLINSRLVFALPKGRKTRAVPLPEGVGLELSAHLMAHPAGEVALPWERPEAQLAAARLVVRNREGSAVNRHTFNTHTWKPALKVAGIEPLRDNGVHALRHWFASVLLDAGESTRRSASTSGTPTRASR